MEILIFILIIAFIIGAILGGKSFGGTIRKGCGCLALLAIIFLGIYVMYISDSGLGMNSNNEDAVSLDNPATYLFVQQNCPTYAKPNIESDVTGQLVLGKRLLVENINKYKYFYEVADENGKYIYVRKECLVKR
jgi:hypothetical protein